MVMHLDAQTDLRPEDLEEDVKDPKIQEFLNLRIADNIVFLDSNDQHQRPNFIRSSGFNLKTGVLHLGDIQFEKPAVKILRGYSLPPERTVVEMTTRNWKKQVGGKPALFAIERLFSKPLQSLEVTAFYCDGRESPELREIEKVFVDREMAKYKEMLESSIVGKPLIEADYKARKWTRLADGVDMNMLYGKRIHGLLRENMF